MAKATVKLTCRECGAEFTKENTLRNRAEANEWEAWAAKNYDLCPACYRKQRQEEEAAKGLIGELAYNAEINFPESEEFFVLIATGDSYNNKEILKAAGYRFGYSPAASPIQMTNAVRPPKVWYKPGADKDALISEFEGLGGKVTKEPDEIASAAFTYELNQKLEEYKEKKKKLEELGPIPPFPDDIVAIWPAGAKWNCTVYGRAGSYYIYLNNNPIRLTDDQKQRLEAAYAAREEWEKRKKEMRL